MGPSDIAQLIRHERRRQNLRLEDLAEKVGLTAGALSHIENGRRLPSAENAVAIAGALGLDEALMLGALDEAHRERRYDSLSASRSTESQRPAASSHESSISPRSYMARDINDLFGVDPAASRAQRAPRSFAFDSSSRDAARWSEDTSERIEALGQMADTASRAIRTLRGLVHDDDPTVSLEARRLLRELDVRMPGDL